MTRARWAAAIIALRAVCAGAGALAAAAGAGAQTLASPPVRPDAGAAGQEADAAAVQPSGAVDEPGLGDEPAGKSVALPRVLSDQDAARYREVFALQKEGKWPAADRLIRALDNPILMGHVLYQRLMHPTAYRSRYRELKDWLRRYRDHPGAWAVYRLAKRRGGPRARPPRPPAADLPLRTLTPSPAPKALAAAAEVRRGAQEERHVKAFFAKLSHEVRRRHLEHAERYTWAILRTGLLSRAEVARAFGTLVKAFFLAGDDDKAVALADIGREESEPLIDADLAWYGGLAAFREDRTAMAAAFLRAGADAAGGADQQAASAFWAARALLRLGDLDGAQEMLRRAARTRESFYGLLALRILGDPLDFDWRKPQLDAETLAHLVQRTPVRRILALAEVGQVHRADEEMRLLLARSDDADWPALAALASRLRLPASQLALTRLLSDESVTAAMRYPLPDWEPAGGFRVDRALLFAFMHQESKFRTRARSRVGASGLMQVMPATASYVTGDRSLRWRRSRLYDPAFNMAVGQRYISYLLDLEPVARSLVLLAVAYNAGPGNLQRWRRTVKGGEDPLLFIEAIPVAETRDYVERVLANLWLYRLQLGQDVPSLDALASGAWPVYEPLDEEPAPALARAGVLGAAAAR